MLQADVPVVIVNYDQDSFCGREKYPNWHRTMGGAASQPPGTRMELRRENVHIIYQAGPHENGQFETLFDSMARGTAPSKDLELAWEAYWQLDRLAEY